MSSQNYLEFNKIYNTIPPVNDHLSFYLPCKKALYACAVEIHGDIYELWSPNANVTEYYPGSPLKEPLASYDASYHYHDGRLGPHHWSLHPQHFYPTHLWLGFCLSPCLDIHDWRSMPLEVVPLPTVWIPSECTAGQCTLNPESFRHLSTALMNYMWQHVTTKLEHQLLTNFKMF
jgi:hypothetical protein